MRGKPRHSRRGGCHAVLASRGIDDRAQFLASLDVEIRETGNVIGTLENVRWSIVVEAGFD